MSTDSIVADTYENDHYNEGYDDGMLGHWKSSNHPDYLQGYYHGVEEKEDRRESGDFDYDDYDYED